MLPPDPPTLARTGDPRTNANQRGQETAAGHLEQRAQRLAAQHADMAEASTVGQQFNSLPKLATRLGAVYNFIARSSADQANTVHATEWVLDNYYLLDQTRQEIEGDLPTGYYRQLPKLVGSGPGCGYPRTFSLARAYVINDECQFDGRRFARFVTAYQQHQPLTMGEIWALPIMLRYAFLASVVQAGERITGIVSDSAEADDSFDAVWDLAHLVNDNEVVAHSIPSLRAINTEDWNVFFEEVSQVERVLCDDPAGMYAYMDFTTRDRYRDEIETIARTAGLVELDVAHAALALAQAALQATTLSRNSIDVGTGDFLAENLDIPRTSHIGYYLLSEGRAVLEQRVGCRPTLHTKQQRWVLAHPALVYLGSIGLLAAAVVATSVAYAASADGLQWLIGLAGLLALIPAMTLAVDVVNWVITRLLSPRVLPKLDFAQGIPPSCRTMVVVPALIANTSDVASLLNQIELHYLRNPDPNLGFALLSDYADAPEQTMPEDAALLAEAESGIAALNHKYPNFPFYLFHRRRLWNPAEGAWMGWERKRGKLHEFNRLLRGDANTSHIVRLGEQALLPQVRYVITLDADTILPREQAQQLIGTLAHPLNCARFDARTGKVVAGYSVLQPRTEIKPMSANQSLFTQIFAGDVGIDLYSRAVSDLYQDLFGAGSYVGKGIYAVDAFEQSLDGRVPENSLLSHDLFEGMHGRVGLVTDIVLYEEYPPHYLVNIQRSHRWVRGDWQLLPWLLPWTPRTSHQSPIHSWAHNDLSLIDRWKIVDNLRRSLLAPALLLLLLAGWTILPGNPLLWTLLASLIPLFAVTTGALSGMASAADRSTNVTWGSLLRPLRDNVLRWFLFLAFLPHETLITLDAIGRTLIRLLFTHRNMLQWTTAANAVRLFGENATAGTTLTKMLPSILLVLLLALLVGLLNIAALPIAAPYLVVWLLASQIAYQISRPTEHTIDAGAEALTTEQRQQLRILAQRTWLFYERFVGPDDHWLPPDHFQETPRGLVAHRTSPTNIGLYLLAVLAARDLGYIGLSNLSLRLRFAFESLDRLGCYRGHFLNWIDTSTLTPLPPGYVSTVDSGNLAACLIVLKQGCADLPQEPIWDWKTWQGLLDLLALLMDAAVPLGIDQATSSARPSPLGLGSGDEELNLSSATNTSPLLVHLEEIQRRILAVRVDTTQWLPLLTWLLQEGQPELSRRLVDAMETSTASIAPEILHDWRVYIEQMQQRLVDMQREIDQMLPWSAFLQQPPPLFSAANAPLTYRAAWDALCDALPGSPTLDAIPAICAAGQTQLQQVMALLSQTETNAPAVDVAHIWCDRLSAALDTAQVTAQTLLDTLLEISNQAEGYVAEMDFGFLFDQQRQVFHIGYNIDSGQLDNSYYDLLASEARIASIVAIAKHDVPYTHWLHLGRPMTRLASGEQVLLSWSGTMFEYLMPPLLMHSYPGTLLDQSYHAMIGRQIEYGRQQGVPWGISESGFYAFDAAMNYQYHAFGAPGLGYQRGLDSELVVAPYASLLALPFAPQATMANLAHLRQLGLVGPYGFYEAVDFTPAHLQLGAKQAIVRSYMAHHQGMILLALADALQGPKMIDRFHAEPAIQGVEMLLQEQIPRHALIQYPHEAEIGHVRADLDEPMVLPWRVPMSTPVPLVHLLSNGRYSLLVTNAGGGYSRWGALALTRWRADPTLDDWGCWLYVQDMEDLGNGGPLWAIGRQPTGSESAQQEVLFHPHKVELRRRDHDITVHMEITVAPDDDVEIRRIHLSNDSDRPRRLRLTTYGEIVLAPPDADVRHPAFTKLFVESEYIPALKALIFRRRPRTAEESPIYLGHMMVVEAGLPGAAGPTSVQTNRAHFIGRGHTPALPAALRHGGNQAPLDGATLDPIMSLGQEMIVPPRTTVRLTAITLVAPSRAELLTIAGRYQTSSTIDRAFDRAYDAAAQELRQLVLHGAALEQIQQLLSLLLYPHAALRADAATLAANRQDQSQLWGFGISGDNPIVLLKLNDEAEGELLKTLLQAHTYWRRRGLQIDLVILNRQATNYGQALSGYTARLIRSTESEPWLNQRGGIFLLRDDQLHEVDRILLQTAARVILDGAHGSLGQQLAGLLQHPTTLPPFAPALNPAEVADMTPVLPRPTDLQFDNGLGGFSADGREYVIYLTPGDHTPVPWSNVIANANFGFLVSERGGGYTWAANSGENRLTPWQNDPVRDRPGEVIYLRDEETGEIWSPTPALPATTPYLVRHGAGYSTFEHNSHNLRQQVRLFVATDAPIKIVQVRLENSSPYPRRVTATYYAEWVLGVDRESTQQYIVPEYCAEEQALLGTQQQQYRIWPTRGVSGRQ
jgi:cyclic beta-1,2-glucan synthetase